VGFDRIDEALFPLLKVGRWLDHLIGGIQKVFLSRSREMRITGHKQYPDAMNHEYPRPT
jgi:hypothetical protein